MEPIAAHDAMTEIALRSMHDLALPSPVSWVPQTWGWGVLASLLALALVIWIVRAIRRYRANAYRREALVVLAAIEPSLRPHATRQAAVQQVALLVKRVAIAAWGRKAAGSLSGSVWAAFISNHGDEDEDAKRLLPQLVDDFEYRDPAVLNLLPQGLGAELARDTKRWIEGIMYELDHPWLLLMLPVPAVAWWLLPPHTETSASIRLPFFADVAEAAGLTPTQGAVIPRKTWPQFAIEVLAWCLVVLALARPQFVEPPIEKSEPQRDILLVLDMSQSMETSDFRAPDGNLKTRIEAVKTVVSGFVSRRPGDRIGLVAFGDAPYPLAPFTMDHELVRTMIEDLKPGIAGPRTALGDSLGLAIRMFEKTSVPQKVLILLTDGNDTASKMPPLKSADIAAMHGIVVHAVGIGDPQATGEQKLDADTLGRIAAKTKGRYFFGGDQVALEAIYDTIDQITPQDQKILSWRPRVDLFQWPLGGAVVILAAGYLSVGAYGFLRRRAPS